MSWWIKLGIGRTPDEQEERLRVRARLAEQERRVEALDRVVEVIQRQLAEDDTRGAETMADAPREMA